MELFAHLNQGHRPTLVLVIHDSETARDAEPRMLRRSGKMAAAARSSPPRLQTPAAGC
jgi:predicted ABC-type transport system involved in lysophospholipase L1 biosynthesis ATPase subunit